MPLPGGSQKPLGIPPAKLRRVRGGQRGLPDPTRPASPAHQALENLRVAAAAAGPCEARETRRVGGDSGRLLVRGSVTALVKLDKLILKSPQRGRERRPAPETRAETAASAQTTSHPDQGERNQEFARKREGTGTRHRATARPTQYRTNPGEWQPSPRRTRRDPDRNFPTRTSPADAHGPWSWLAGPWPNLHVECPWAVPQKQSSQAKVSKRHSSERSQVKDPRPKIPS